MSDLARIGDGILRVATRLNQARTCHHVRLNYEQRRECELLALRLEAFADQLIEESSQLRLQRSGPRRKRRRFDPLEWLATNPTEPSTPEVQHV